MLVELSRSFWAMNTDVEAVVCVDEESRGAGEIALGRVQGLFEKVEKGLTRFRPDSELSRLNALAGRPFRASSLLFDVLKVALQAARETGGLFDPTVLAGLLAAGYDRSFERLAGQDRSTGLARGVLGCTWQNVILGEKPRTVYMPFNCGIDLGGIGKGWTVDRACRDLSVFPGYAVDADGDMAVGGIRADGSEWTIAIANPWESDYDMLILGLSRGAVCTSSTARRRWLMAGGWQHHLIDPRTGKPSDSDVVSATVVAQSAVQAETLTKAAILLGGEAGMRLIESRPGIAGLLVLEDGCILRSAGLPEALLVA